MLPSSCVDCIHCGYKMVMTAKNHCSATISVSLVRMRSPVQIWLAAPKLLIPLGIGSFSFVLLFSLCWICLSWTVAFYKKTDRILTKEVKDAVLLCQRKELKWTPGSLSITFWTQAAVPQPYGTSRTGMWIAAPKRVAINDADTCRISIDTAMFLWIK